MRSHDFDAYDDDPQFARMRRPRNRGERTERAQKHHLEELAYYAEQYGEFDNHAGLDAPEHGDRWSTWYNSSPETRGPRPYPDWIITDHAAVDTEFGVLKTGKEADVFLLERSVPDDGRAVLMAAKRYRDPKHRLFHRDDGYREGRRNKESRVERAMQKGTSFGREAVAVQWANAEFAALSQLWSAGVAVPYPVQIVGTELLMEYIGSDDGQAAPRLAQIRPSSGELDDLWEQLRQSLSLFARSGYAHGDLSAYNVLVHDGRLVVIDVPQIVDLIANPHGAEFLTRDVRNVGAWFTARGLPESRIDELVDDLMADAGIA